jgi:uracil-DNA glycosylase
MQEADVSKVRSFITELAQLRLPDSFNPYSQLCADHDCRGATAIRRANLQAFLEAGVERGSRTVWVGRDLGHRGGRRTGIPLTDEVCLPLLAQKFRIEGVSKATRTHDVGERTAAEVWQMARELPELPIFWNAFPYHPHDPQNAASNRKHTKAELEATEHLLARFLALLNPSVVIALGNDAHRVLTRHGQNPILVRHPSYGGIADFRRGIGEAYSRGLAG